ncbi:RHS repeat-associated core domain-containing protein [Stenotrophomonas sp. AS012628]|uniref:RHS repeat domain-containing protein n=1 Tax=Stenotrophomonas sp. AS012628 TaxID=2597656 RepID=UPI00177E35FD|nr:RHS repeat-associated core domain-containing protein [Stenotrophomonas sp. AS012628]
MDSMLLIRAVLAVVVLAACVAPAAAQEVVDYIHTDALGSPVAITDASGNVIERTVYEPYGAVVNRPLKDGPGYTGHVTDSGTGLSYMQQRYYDPEASAFLSVDPISATEAAFGRYYYANGNPYRFTDPDGRAPEEKVRSARVATVGSAIKGGGVAPGSRMGTLGGGGSRNGGGGESPSGAGPTGAPTADGRIPVPSAVGWKTGTYDMTWDPARVDAAGAVISGAGVVGGAAIAADAGIPYLAAASSPIARGVANTWKNLSFDGPSPGGLHANGRLAGVRWKGGQWGIRLDLHPIRSEGTPILHINYGPANRGEAAHLVLFDPRWIKK